jgi:hypothetical protein
MSHGAATDTGLLDKTLGRLETLTVALDSVTDSKAREAARELMEVLLDLHGLALARALAVVAKADGSTALMQGLAADPHVRAVLLLHGLHPQDADTRLKDVIARMHPQWSERGFRVDLIDASANAARVRLHKNGSAEPAEQLRREIEEILVDAAPDLDEITIEFDSAPAKAVAAPA